MAENGELWILEGEGDIEEDPEEDPEQESDDEEDEWNVVVADDDDEEDEEGPIEIADEGPIEEEIWMAECSMTSQKKTQNGEWDRLSSTLKGVPNRRKQLERRKRHRQNYGGEVDSAKCKIARLEVEVRQLRKELRNIKESSNNRE